MSIQSSLRSGVRSTLRSGLNPSDSAASLAGVTRDATSGIYCPANATEWASVLAVAGITSGGPSALWLMQEASGNPADFIGSFTLTASGTLLYQQAVTGWTRKGIQTTAGVGGIMQSAAAGLPDIATQSCLLLGYVGCAAIVGTTRTLMQMGTIFAACATAQLAVGAPNRRARYELDPNTTTGADDASTAVRPYAIKVDRTGSVGALYTDLEKLAPALAANPAGKTVLFGGDNAQTNFPDICQYVYGAALFLGAAEISDANMRLLYQTLGWTVSW